MVNKNMPILVGRKPGLNLVLKYMAWFLYVLNEISDGHCQWSANMFASAQVLQIDQLGSYLNLTRIFVLFLYVSLTVIQL